MHKAIFDITIPDTSGIDWQRCRLIMEVNQQYFHYVIVNGKNILVALKYFRFDGSSSGEVLEAITEIVNTDGFLQQKMLESIIIYNWPESQLIPEKHFHIDMTKEFASLVHGDLQKSVVLSEKIQGWGSYNLFRIPVDMHAFFQQRFKNAKYWHYYSIWLECRYKAPSGNPDSVNVIFYPNKILVAVIADNELKLVQSYVYDTADDVSYYLLSMYEHFNLSQDKTPLYIGGMIDGESSLYTELLKYFGSIRPDTLPESLRLTENFREFPDHFFSPLLKLAVCVS